MPALRDYLKMKKGVVFTLDQPKLSADDFFKELETVEFSLLTLLRLLIRVDISHFTDQDSFTGFFLKLFNKNVWAKVRRYLNETAGQQAEGGGKKSLRKRIKTTRKKSKSVTASSSRSRVRTSRKGRSK
jgi:hypothetical protein